MKLSSEQIAVINRYTDERLIDREKLIAYLERHRTIKNEVFKYCSRKVKSGYHSNDGYCFYLDSVPMYTPVDRETFIRRIPFYFFQLPVRNDSMSGLYLILPYSSKKSPEDFDYDEFYKDLEWMFYDLHISLEAICDYSRSQIAPSSPRNGEESPFYDRIADAVLRDHGLRKDTVFKRWRHYLRLCVELGWQDYTPERFITAYNEALVKTGKDPIIYYPIDEYLSIFKYFIEDHTLRCRGNFPCDKNGKPILKWTSFKVRNPASTAFDEKKSACGELRIDCGPKTIIYMRDEDSSDSSEIGWTQIYAGPQTMSFDHTALREYRKKAKLTQSEVADAIGTSVRTYQKWENGETTPDGHFLIRIMNWLDIGDVQQLTRVIDLPENEE